MEDELDAAEIRACAREIAVRDLLIDLAIDEDADRLPRANLANDLTVDPTDGVDLVRPVDGVMRPDQPGSLMPLPFRRHREAKSGGCGGGFVRGFVPGHRWYEETTSSAWHRIEAGAFLDLAGGRSWNHDFVLH